MRPLFVLLGTILVVAIAAGFGAIAFGRWVEAYFQQRVYDYAQPSVLIGGQTVNVAIADTDFTREQGLSGHPSLGANEGMLFVFQSDGYWAFWMKDMRFSIDMIWINSQGYIIHIASDVSPNTYPTAFRPSTPARYVLELPAGFSDVHNVQVGDSVQLPKSIQQ